MDMQPNISILVAARNEASNILDLFASIENINYPKEKLDVLIGDDASNDETATIIQNYIADKPHYQLFEIVEKRAGLLGKTNVLAQLTAKAKGDYFFITDADIKLPQNWISSMLDFKTENVGVITGVTIVDGPSIFHKCQAIEWLVALKLIKTLSDFKVPVTGMGNNMAVSKNAYEAVGGYEKIGFSIVEDYAIFKGIVAKNFEFIQHFNRDVLATTKPPANLKTYFQQRKRWLTGGIKSGSVLLIPAFLQALLLPFLLVLAFLNLKITLLFWGVFFGINMVVAIKAILKTKQNHLLANVIPFHGYLLVFMFLQLVFYIYPSKINWKGREY